MSEMMALRPEVQKALERLKGVPRTSTGICKADALTPAKRRNEGGQKEVIRVSEQASYLRRFMCFTHPNTDDLISLLDRVLDKGIHMDKWHAFAARIRVD